MDSFGRLLALRLSPGQASDHKHAPALAVVAAKNLATTVVADKGYDSRNLRELLADCKMEPVIPARKNSLEQPYINPYLYKQRNIVERFIENRRVATGYDEKALHYEVVYTLGCDKGMVKIYLLA